MVKKRVLIILIVVVAIGVCTAVYVRYKYNEKPKSVEDIASSDIIKVSATDITKEYAADEPKANAKYLDKVIEISGMISEVGNNQDGAAVITLETGDPMAGVQCTMREKQVAVVKGGTVILKGFCKGNNMGVIVNDCVVK